MTDKQLGMFGDVCANRHGGSDESHDAFEDTKKHKEKLLEAILDHVRSCGARGATAHEIAAALGLYLQTSSARCSELKANGHLMKYGRRETETGSWAAVLVVPEFFPKATP